MQSVTLFQLYGHGDTLNVSWAPKLLKERIPNLKVNFGCKKSHVCFFDNNKFVDNVFIVSDSEALRCRRIPKPNLFKDELNVWCGSGKTNEQLLSARNWDIPWESAKIINNFFGRNIINVSDNLLPEMFYTQEEIDKADQFFKDHFPYIVLELECFSGQHFLSPDALMKIIGSKVTKDIKMFTSCFSSPIISPFHSLNNYTIREVGLIIERSLAFYGIASGLSVVSWERNLKEPKKRIVAYHNDLWASQLRRYRTLENTKSILTKDFLPFVVADINAL